MYIDNERNNEYPKLTINKITLISGTVKMLLLLTAQSGFIHSKVFKLTNDRRVLKILEDRIILDLVSLVTPPLFVHSFCHRGHKT